MWAMSSKSPKKFRTWMDVQLNMYHGKSIKSIIAFGWDIVCF